MENTQKSTASDAYVRLIENVSLIFEIVIVLIVICCVCMVIYGISIHFVTTYLFYKNNAVLKELRDVYSQVKYDLDKSKKQVGQPVYDSIVHGASIKRDAKREEERKKNIDLHKAISTQPERGYVPFSDFLKTNVLMNTF